MQRQIVVLVVLGLWVLGSLALAAAGDLVWQDIGRGNTNIKAILIDSDNPRSIYFGCQQQGIFKSEDRGESWRNILSVPGQSRTVNLLLFDPRNKNFLYAATGAGLYYSCSQGKSWKRIFQGKNYLERECTSVAVLPYALYVGTKAGLFASKDNGRSWQKCAGIIGNSRILSIAYNLKEPDYIYVACIGGVFRSENRGQSWRRIFVVSATEDSEDREEEPDTLDEEEQLPGIRYISCDPNNLNRLYLATAKGVYQSWDKGENWEMLSIYGLLSQDVKYLSVSVQSNLYAVTKSGVFEYKNSRWQELSLGLMVEEVNTLALDNQGNLYAACDKGLFQASIDYSMQDKPADLTALYSQDEPDISAVQQAAIKYAEVEPEKIRQWRKQAAKKALLPQVSVGLDRNTTDLWHWEGGSTTKTDDDILRRGRDAVEWDVSLSWDLGELIWNDDQTSIDVRSRLMVQLRDDILDEVTKLYFERLRVRAELDNLSIEDRKKRFEKELKIQELTASLDALTGGYFSEQINKNKAS